MTVIDSPLQFDWKFAIGCSRGKVFLKTVLLATLSLAVFKQSTGETDALQIALGFLLLFLLTYALSMDLRSRRTQYNIIRPWKLLGVVVLTNLIVAAYEGLDLLVWAKFSLPILGLPTAAILTSACFRRDNIQPLFVILLFILAIPTVVFAVLLFARGFSLGAIGLDSIRELTDWHEGIGHFGFLLTLLTFPFLGRRRFLMFGFFFLGVFALLASGVRSLWITLLVSILVVHLFLVWRAGSSIRNIVLTNLKVASGICLAVFVLAVIGKFVPEITLVANERAAAMIAAGVVENDSMQDRFEEGDAILSAIIDRPLVALLGAGAGGYFRYTSAKQRSASFDNYQNYSHNFYLHLLWNYGGLALILFLWGLVRLMRTVFEDSANRSGFARSFCHALSLTLFGTAFVANVSSFYDAPRWYLLFGIFAGATCVLRDTDRCQHKAWLQSGNSGTY